MLRKSRSNVKVGFLIHNRATCLTLSASLHTPACQFLSARRRIVGRWVFAKDEMRPSELIHMLLTLLLSVEFAF